MCSFDYTDHMLTVPGKADTSHTDFARRVQSMRNTGTKFHLPPPGGSAGGLDELEDITSVERPGTRRRVCLDHRVSCRPVGDAALKDRL